MKEEVLQFIQEQKNKCEFLILWIKCIIRYGKIDLFIFILFNIQYIIIFHLYFMEFTRTGDGVSAQMVGHNFHGSIELKGKELHINATEFKKGRLYTSLITNQILESDENRRYLIFKKIQDLFNELIQNKKFYITDQNFLVVPFNVTYKSKIFELNLYVPLVQINLNSQAQTTQTLLQQIEKMSQQKARIEQILSTPKMLYFVGDQTNKNYSHFRLSQNGRKVQKTYYQNQWNIFNHFEILPKKGIFTFKIKTLTKNVMVGICGQIIKSQIKDKAYKNPLFMGLFFGDGKLYGNNKTLLIIPAIPDVTGSIIEIQINMNKQLLSWIYCGKIYTADIWSDLINSNICPMIALCNFGDKIELLHK